MKAALLLLEHADEPGTYLFAKRHEDRESLPGCWSLPAETVEPGESPEEAAVRCAYEELGLDLDIEDVERVEQHTFPEHDKTLYYFVARYHGEPRIREERELTEVERYTLDTFFERYDDSDIGHGLQYLRDYNGKLR